MATDRERFRGTFEIAAGRYDRARPVYPSELFDELLALTAVVAGDRVLEIGCGTGIATRALAARGLRVTCVELGSALAAVARENLADMAEVEVLHGSFEEWEAPVAVRFDLVVAATAWHWIDPAVRYHNAWRLLRRGGHLAYWSATHVFPVGGDPFFREIKGSTRRSARLGRVIALAKTRRVARPARRDRGQRRVSLHRHPPVCLGGQLHRR